MVINARERKFAVLYLPLWMYLPERAVRFVIGTFMSHCISRLACHSGVELSN
jgi:hypothetical protein